MTAHEEQKNDKGNAPETGQTSLGAGLRSRLLSALVLIPVSLGFVYAGGWAFAVSLIFVTSLMAFEWCRLVLGPHHKTRLPAYVILYTLSLIVVIALAQEQMWSLALVVTGGTAVFVYLLASRQKLKAVWPCVGVLYLFVPMVSFIWLREGTGQEMEPGYGFATIVWVLLVVWGSDSGGYIAGKSIGGPKLAPGISPNKTWSGFAGGLTLAMIAGLAMSLWVGAGSTLMLVLISAGLSTVSQIGDLVESWVKRRYDVKDFSALIPGHGGVLDRFDGLLFALMAAGLLQIFHGPDMLVWGGV